MIDAATVMAGEVLLSSGGLASGVEVDGYYNEVYVDASAIASGVVLVHVSDAYGQNDQVYGVAVATVVSSGGQEDVQYGGVVRNAVVSHNGEQVFSSGGSVSGTHVRSGW